MKPLLVLLCLLACSAPAWATREQCPQRLARDARDHIDGLRDWDAMYVWYTNYSRCDAGDLRRAYSDHTARLLVFEWSHFNHLKALWIFDKKFKTFVLGHIDDSIAPDLLEKMDSNARTSCPLRSVDMCLLVEQAAEAASTSAGNPSATPR